MRIKKPEPFAGFLLIFFALITFQLSLNQIYLSDRQDGHSLLAISTSNPALTYFNAGSITIEAPLIFHFISILITQLSSLSILSMLLWYYWRLFGNTDEIKYGFGKAVKTTVTITLIAELGLFLFFIYALSGQENNSELSSISTAALGLAVNSFANSGLPGMSQLIKPEIIQQSFILQIGFIAGSSLGNFGIFVLYELFAPGKLRERMANPLIDWSYITKIVVFGTAVTIIIASIGFYFLESGHFLSDKNIVESVIASVYEISSARGFGTSIAEGTLQNGSLMIKFIVSLIAAGPFSTGGGLTLLVLAWIYSLLLKKHQKSREVKTANSILKNLILYAAITFSVLLLLSLTLKSDIDLIEIAYQQWLCFSNQQLSMNLISDWQQSILASVTIIVGRLGFVIACFLTLRNLKPMSFS